MYREQTMHPTYIVHGHNNKQLGLAGVVINNQWTEGIVLSQEVVWIAGSSCVSHMRELFAVLILERLEQLGWDWTVKDQVARGQLDLFCCMEAAPLGGWCWAIVACIWCTWWSWRGGRWEWDKANGASSTRHVKVCTRRVVRGGSLMQMRRRHGHYAEGLLIWGIGARGQVALSWRSWRE